MNTQKTILFNIVGTTKLGLGHVYRALTLANLVKQHNVIFYCKEDSLNYCCKIIGDLFPINSNEKDIWGVIDSLNVDLVINDILNTSEEFMLGFVKRNIHTINFEDLGAGSKHADLVINELFDEPVNDYKNVLWGNKYSVLRDEFLEAEINKYTDKVDSVLITFGGTDQGNLTSKVLGIIYDVCLKHDVNIYIVTGLGYSYIEKLEESIKWYVKKGVKVEFFYHSGVISSIMQKCQIAITANGRMVYELAHLNLPSIILSHHERETTHLFAKIENGFFPLGMYAGEETKRKIRHILETLIEDNSARLAAYERIKKNTFIGNNDRILKLINEVVEK